MTKLGRLVKERKITRLEEIFKFSIPIKEYQIVDELVAAQPRQAPAEGEEDTGGLKDDVMKIMPVQKQTRAGQRTRFKAFVVVGDGRGHVGLGVKCSSEVATAIRGAIVAAKLSIVPIRMGFWGAKIGEPHTVPCKVTGKCGSVRMRLIPAPRGTGLVASTVPKKILQFAGLSDCYTSARGATRTQGNFAKATFEAVKKTYSYLTPNLWGKTELSQGPYQQFSDFLKDTEASAAKAEDQNARG